MRRSALFLAGLELPVLHLGLALAALPVLLALSVRLGLPRSLLPFARAVHRSRRSGGFPEAGGWWLAWLSMTGARA